MHIKGYVPQSSNVQNKLDKSMLIPHIFQTRKTYSPDMILILLSENVSYNISVLHYDFFQLSSLKAILPTINILQLRELMSDTSLR